MAAIAPVGNRPGVEEEAGVGRAMGDVLEWGLEVDGVAERESAAEMSVFMILVLGFVVVEFDPIFIVLVALAVPRLEVSGGEDGFGRPGGKVSGIGESEVAAAIGLVDGGEGEDPVGGGDAVLGVGDEVELVDVSVGDKRVVDKAVAVAVSSRGPPSRDPMMVVQLPIPLMNSQISSKSMLMSAMPKMG